MYPEYGWLPENIPGLDDGIYDLSDLEVLHVGPRDEAQGLAFLAQYPNAVFASAYETYTAFLISDMPKPFAGKYEGSGFNYGSTNVLENCPSRILILAEND